MEKVCVRSTIRMMGELPFLFLCPRTGGSGLHGLDDVLISGAATEVPGDGFPDLLLAGVLRLEQEWLQRHEKARRAETALQRVVLVKRLLKWMELAVEPLRHALDGPDRAP